MQKTSPFKNLPAVAGSRVGAIFSGHGRLSTSAAPTTHSIRPEHRNGTKRQRPKFPPGYPRCLAKRWENARRNVVPAKTKDVATCTKRWLKGRQIKKSFHEMLKIQRNKKKGDIKKTQMMHLRYLSYMEYVANMFHGFQRRYFMEYLGNIAGF